MSHDREHIVIPYPYDYPEDGPWTIHRLQGVVQLFERQLVPARTRILNFAGYSPESPLRPCVCRAKSLAEIIHEELGSKLKLYEPRISTCPLTWGTLGETVAAIEAINLLEIPRPIVHVVSSEWHVPRIVWLWKKLGYRRWLVRSHPVDHPIAASDYIGEVRRCRRDYLLAQSIKNCVTGIPVSWFLKKLGRLPTMPADIALV